jgi:basic amino acid/polyamine antiporter, APA family
LPEKLAADSQPHLTRGFGLLHATALNMSNMAGVGPFITIPLLLSTMGGPQAMLGWVTGALLVASDGLIWSELGAALPSSGGSYHFLREAYGRERWGRAMAFLFIWQFVLSGPLEIASGMVGFGNYASYLWPGMTPGVQQGIAVAVGVAAVLLLSRRIAFLAKATLTLWAGTVLTMVGILVCGLPHFSAHRAFDVQPGALAFNRGFFLGLGSATLVVVYNYLGYYDVCYIGDEVRDPARVVPRSILYSIGICCVAYLAINLVLIGVVPWREALHSNFIVSDFMERLYGRGAALLATVMILWTAFGSVFALLLGYSRIPYAAAREGYFFRPFAHLHPTKHYPGVSLFVLGGVSIAAAFLKLDQLVSAVITTRILVQFLGQLFAIPLFRRRMSAAARPYKMWLYPVPLVIAFFGWAFVFLTSGWLYITTGLLTLLVGVLAFLVWARWTTTWPFGPAAAHTAPPSTGQVSIS